MTGEGTIVHAGISTWPLALAATLAVLLGASAIAIGRCRTVSAVWRWARLATVVAAAVSAAIVASRIVFGAQTDDLIRIDSVAVVMLCVVALVGWVVVRFSSAYLAGDRRETRYAQLMLATLASVSGVVVANNMIVLIAAWAATSFCLHGLLTHFRERPVAVAVAHKKFLLARCADACLITAAVLLWSAFGTMRIDQMGVEALSAGSLPGGAQWAIGLVVVAALLKSAQLPFHGWLIQVMEAPTPVSALLHAGVVNLGGFVLIRFAPVVDQSTASRAMLVIVGGTTAVLASLVMTTRVSVKVSLAWSTCAQMGFMFVQCGLGLWEMALLHLAAHSCYKAHAFLSAGSTVRRTQIHCLSPGQPPLRIRDVALSATIAALATVLVALAWQALPGTGTLSLTIWVLLGVVALALTPLTEPIRRQRITGSVLGGLAVPALYLALHEIAAQLVPSGPQAPPWLLVFTAVAFAALFVMQTGFRVRPNGAWLSRVRPWIYSGLFLDDTFTRVAYVLSPPPSPAAPTPSLELPRSVAVVRQPRPAAAPTQHDTQAVVTASAISN
jgi:NAD(P)H-quinone oxidoreductase subunit 5